MWYAYHGHGGGNMKQIRFDSRDKKPKVWNIAVLSLITAVLMGIIILLKGTSASLLCIIMSVYLIITIALLLSAFIKQLQYNPYSYNTIIYVGFAIFLLFVLITFFILTKQILQFPEEYTGEQIVYTLLSSAKSYMIITFPFIAVFSIALCISNISLIRHEGFRFVNVLGIILAFLLVAGDIFLYRADYYASGSLEEVRMHDLLVNTFAAVYLYFECMLIGTIIANIIVVRHEPAYNKDYVIVLGCGLRPDGTPSPLLRGRIDRAVAFRNKQKEAAGKDIVFVTSGGKGPDEVISESESMKNYLVEQGIPEEEIIMEDKSRTTLENMKFSKEKIEEHGGGKVIFSTTNYHVFRSGIWSRRVKMRATGIGAKTKWYFWPNASVREFVGLLTEHRGKQAAILICMLILYWAMTVYIYRY